MTEQITGSEKRELAGLIEESGMDVESALERIVRQNIAAYPDLTERQAQERVFASLKAGIARRRRLRGRLLGYAAGAAALIALCAGIYFSGGIARGDDAGGIMALSNAVVLEYPSGKNLALADRSDVSAIIRQDTAAQAEPDAELYKIKVPPGASHAITLEDGTTVLLFPGSELQFPASFAASERSVRLSGEGYFDVRHDASRPFTVHAGEASVVVLGTSFNVRAYAAEATVQAALVSGRVVINGTPLQPNQMGVLDRTLGSVTVEEIGGGAYLERAGGMFVFEDKTIDQIMCELSLWFDFEYSYADSALKEKKFRFKLSRTEGFGRLTELMSHTGEVDFAIDGKHVSISAARP